MEWFFKGLAVFGALGAFLSLTDRFWAPSVEVLGILPAYVRGTDEVTIAGQRQIWPRRGVSFILELRSGNREVSITELEISGKLYLTFNEWIAHRGTNGASLKELGDQLEQRRPFHEVRWIGWPDGESRSLRLRPYETCYARFTFLEPTSQTRGYSTHPDYLGFSSPKVHPTLVRHDLAPHEFFRYTGDDGMLNLPAEISTRELRLCLRANRKEIYLDHRQIQSVKRIQEDQWRSKPVIDLYHNRDPKFPTGEMW